MTPAVNVVLHHVGVVATDVALSVAFYERLLDGVAAPMAGHTVVTSGEVRIAIVARRESQPQTPAWGNHIAFRFPVDARPALVARLGELGVGHEDVGGRVYSRDPDGMTLEFLFE